jgi:hypothetical protein
MSEISPEYKTILSGAAFLVEDGHIDEAERKREAVSRTWLFIHFTLPKMEYT